MNQNKSLEDKSSGHEKAETKDMINNENNQAVFDSTSPTHMRRRNISSQSKCSLQTSQNGTTGTTETTVKYAQPHSDYDGTVAMSSGEENETDFDFDGEHDEYEEDEDEDIDDDDVEHSYHEE